MDSKNWAELNSDCLITIFAKVGDTPSMIESVQFVCKSWYRASLDPRCWEILTFELKCSPNLVKFAVDRSQGCATTVIFYLNFPTEGLRYLADGCPLLKALVFEQRLFDISRADQHFLRWGLSKWKDLEKFKVKSCGFLSDLVETIGVNCKKLVELDCSATVFHEWNTEAIVRCLPQLKSLNMSMSILDRPQLVAILTTCKDLDFLDVSYCKGFVPDDEIHRQASHIKVFNCKHCKEILCDEYDYEEYDYDDEYDYEDYNYDGYESAEVYY